MTIRMIERSSQTFDRLARAVVATTFILLAILNLSGIQQILMRWDQFESTHRLLLIAARFSNVLFLALVATTALLRLRPVAKAQGAHPRITALLGTFLCTSLTLLPVAELNAFWTILSTLMVTTGTTLSFVVLRWLGRSFSIMPEARQLVTTGPYAIVRHPLYLAEEIAAVGILIQCFSVAAVAIVAVHAVLQLLRTANEEKVLRATFPEYADYATRTPWIFPAWSYRRVPVGHAS